MTSLYSRLNFVELRVFSITFFDPWDNNNCCEVCAEYIEKEFLSVQSRRSEIYDADIHSDLPRFMSHVTSFHILMLIIFL